ncbi:MAG: exo-alpha-sialidase [Verrucomicrobiota bacterium]
MTPPSHHILRHLACHSRHLVLCLALVAISLAAQAEDSDWKLRALEYNNPGLKVDLGVGLWAWPLPVDYDNDGDLDLLVSCPDKPSNGVYYFENPSQDPSIAMPVFKAGVRLGPAQKNFQISYVDGTPRLLNEKWEFPHFLSGDFETKEMFYPTTNIHKGKTRARMWRFVDYDGDGDQDLIAGIGDWSDYVWDHAYDNEGRWRNGPLHGYVYLIQNLGNDAKAKWANPTKILAGGGEIDVYGWPSPNFADFDQDGDLDILCGEFMDGFTYFQNIGSRESPVYTTGQKLIGADHKPLIMDLQMITPTAIDWDRDGDIDLIVGDEDGRVALVENTGTFTDANPVFNQPEYFQQEADTLKFGALSTPYAYDWDNDGDEDIVCGNTAGNIAVFENLGDAKNGLPKWSAPQLLEVDGQPFRILAGPSGSIQGPAEAKWGYTTLSVADWDGDQDPDIIYNSIWSKIGILRNDNGTLVDTVPSTGIAEAPPKWYWWQTHSNAALTQWRTTPIAIDWDNDGAMDLIAMDQEGRLAFRPKGGKAQHIFVDENLEPFYLTHGTAGRSGRIKVAIVDWDGDGRRDLLTNSENATWFRNCKDTNDGKVVLKKIGNLARRNVAGHTSSPAVCDFNKDGKPDLLVGAENGRIYYAAHDDCLTFSTEELKYQSPEPMAPPKFPGFVSEEFVFTKASFPQCHASTICETSRGLVVAWFGGTKEKHSDVGIWSSYSDGNNWSTPKEWANGIQHAGHRHPTWNPVLFQGPGDAPTLLFFKTGPDPQSWWGEMMISYDRGRSFRERRRLPESIDGPVRCKPILLDDGKTLLCGSSTEYDGWTVHFEKIGLDDGLPAGNWKRIGPINTTEEFNAIQPTFLRHPDGKLQVLCRTKEGVITTSFSEDDGESWSKMEATNLPNNNSGVEAVTLRDGRHLLVYNHLDTGNTGWGRRGLLNLAISDNGIDWHKVGVLEKEQKGEFSYPAIIQSSDGLVHVTYTWNRQRIKHVVIDPEKIKPGPPLALKPWHESN